MALGGAEASYFRPCHMAKVQPLHVDREISLILTKACCSNNMSNVVPQVGSEEDGVYVDLTLIFVG